MALKSSLVELFYPEHIHRPLAPQSRLPCVTSTKTIDIEIHKLEKLPAAEASSSVIRLWPLPLAAQQLYDEGFGASCHQQQSSCRPGDYRSPFLSLDWLFLPFTVYEGIYMLI